MPRFEIQAPDGRMYEVDAPDQASALAGFQNFQKPQGPRSPGIPAPDAATGAVPDMARIKRNVAKMAGMSAPESEIDGYIASEGTTVDAVRNFRPNAAPPTNVDVPGIGTVEFPAGMSEDAMSAAIRKSFPQLGGTQAAPTQQFRGGVPVGGDGATAQPEVTGPRSSGAAAGGPRFLGTPLDETSWMDDPTLSLEQKQALALAKARRRGAEAKAPQFEGSAMNATAGANESLYGILGAPVDLMRGGMNLASRGINAVAGTDLPQIPEDSFGGSRSIANAMGAMHPALDPKNTTANTTYDRLARGAGQGVAGAMVPAGVVGGLSRAGVLGAQGTATGQALFGRAGNLGEAGLGAAGGAGAVVGQEFASEDGKPLAGLAGGLVGSTFGMGAGVALRGLGRTLQPFTAGGRETLAGRALLEGASNPEALRAGLANPPDALVPSSLPTTGQMTGDLGILGMERGATVRQSEAFAQRRADQNEARIAAMRGIEAGGAPEKVAASVRQHLDGIEAETERLIGEATVSARAQAGALGPGMTPDVAGNAMRGTVEAARAEAKRRERALWDAVDPSGTMTLGLANTRRSAHDLAEELSPLAQPMTPAERQVYTAIGHAGDQVPLRAMQELQSHLKAAMRAERSTNGESPAYRRLAIVAAGISKDFDDAVAGRVAQEAQAVRRGEMRAEDTLMARAQQWSDEWYARKAEAGNVAASGAGPNASGGSIAVSGPRGTAGQARSGHGNAPRHPGLSPATGGAGQGVRPVSLTELRSLGPDDPYFVRSGDGQTFVPRPLANGERSADLGFAPDLEQPGRELPIRIRRSDMVKHVGNDVHQNDARALGYGDTWEMVQDLAASWSQMRKGRYGRVQLVKPAQDGNGVAVVELTPSDDTTYWRVVSAHRNADAQLGEAILTRELPLNAQSGNRASLINGPPQGRQHPALARDRIGPEYTSGGMSGQGGPAFDEAALGRLGVAQRATRERVGTFDNDTLRPFRDRPSTASPYDTPSGLLPQKIFGAGRGSFEAIGQLRAAVGQEAADSAIEGYAVGEVLRHAGRADGTLDEARLSTWRRSHADALRALPALDAKLADAGRASAAIAEVVAARKAAGDAGRKGALGRLVGVDAPEDVTRIVGGVFAAQDAVGRMRSIRQAIGGDAEAVKGLRSAVIEHMADRFVGTAEAGASGLGTMKADGFQGFVRQNGAALREAGFTDAEIGTLQAIGDDLQRAGRSSSAVRNPGGSDTAQNLYRLGKDGSPFGAMARMLLAPGGAGIGIGLTSGSTAGIAAGAATAAFGAMRQAGLRSVQDLVDDALLNPERARLLLEKVKPGEEASRWQALARSYGQSAVRSLAEQQDRPHPDGRRADASPSPSLNGMRLTPRGEAPQSAFADLPPSQAAIAQLLFSRDMESRRQGAPTTSGSEAASAVAEALLGKGWRAPVKPEATKRKAIVDALMTRLA